MKSAEEEHNVRLTLGVVISLLILSAISFILRIWARFATGARLWWDDFWMFWVMAVCIVMSIFDFLSLVYGSGIHQADLPLGTVITFAKLLWVYMLIWAVGVFSVKIGILLFYWRVFQKTASFRLAAIIVTFISTGIFLSNFFSFTFQCLPVQKFWHPKVDGRCIDQNAFYLISAIINVFGDIAVLSLPLPVIWRLHTSRGRKWSLSFLFLLGAFVVVASIFRIVAVTRIDPHDFSFSNVAGGLWSTAEVEVGFVCSNLPAARPLLFKWLGHGNTPDESKATPKYSISSKGGIRTGHIKLPSRNRENDADNSSLVASVSQSKDRMRLLEKPTHLSRFKANVTSATDYEVLMIDETCRVLMKAGLEMNSRKIIGLFAPSDLAYVITLFAIARLGCRILTVSVCLSEPACLNLMERTECNTIIIGSTIRVTTKVAALKEARADLRFIPMPTRSEFDKPDSFSQPVYTRKTAYLYNADLPLTVEYLVATLKEIQPEIFLTIPYVLKFMEEKQEGINMLKRCKFATAAGATEVGYMGDSIYRKPGDDSWAYIRPYASLHSHMFFKRVGEEVYESANDRLVPGLLLFRSSEAAALSGNAFIDAVWPIIEAANKVMAEYARITRDMVVPLGADAEYPATDKDSIIRAATYKKFEDVINKLYKQDLHTSGVVKKQLDPKELEEYIYQAVRDHAGIEVPNYENDFFAAGVDSLRATQLRRLLQHELDIGKLVLPTNAIYDAGNIKKSAETLYAMRTGDKLQNSHVDNKSDIVMMEELISKYSNFTAQRSKPKSDVDVVVGVTLSPIIHF
ncbi:hypothetical protein NUW58_g2991 [Xylaria curta]|uniref:Uncharacterized protein n=1 Tax=Xylaria curta TaxID=42375 RepID=A0ACC1PER7_9PEZI|nr:hypothetical protein NUW58_g2991 [Xylaria curta]